MQPSPDLSQCLSKSKPDGDHIRGSGQLCLAFGSVVVRRVQQMLRSSVHVLGTLFFEYLPLELCCLNTYFFFSKRLVYLAHLLCLWASLAFVGDLMDLNMLLLFKAQRFGSPPRAII